MVFKICFSVFDLVLVMGNWYSRGWRFK